MTDGRAAAQPLTARALGRALLARQHLLARTGREAAEVVGHLVGLQAQAAPDPPYLGLLSRIEGFRAEDLSSLLEGRGAVRIALQRGTIHLVTAADCLALRPLFQPVLDRWIRSSYAKRLPDLDLAGPVAQALAPLAERARALVEQEPRTFQQLGALLAADHPASEPAALAQAARCALPLVQVPPRGCGAAAVRRRTPRPSTGSAGRWTTPPRSRGWCCATSPPSARPPRPTCRSGPGSAASARC
ncbi:hypothetical protein GCM10025734_12520 [Kitasatospora paranensis]